jgi:hypothetical protein
MAILKCFGCGAQKDTDVLEASPYAEEDGIVDYPIGPLHVIDCQRGLIGASEWKVVVVCHECFHKLDPDMWISENCWKSLNPVVPFEKLPLLSKDADRKQRDDPANYQPF